MAEVLCANLTQKYGNVRCTKVGHKTCRGCRLVLVCYRFILFHVPLGKLLTNPGTIDLLQLKDNEGEAVSQDFALLLAASGDLRSLMKTINSLPETYSGTLDFNLNDNEEMVVARNIILLIIAFSFPPSEASVIMIHLWYSAFLPKHLLEAVQSRIVPLFQDVSSLTQEEPTKLLKKTFSYHNITLTATLPKRAWEKILSNFANSSNPLDGWKLAEVLQTSYAAENDIYGQLHQHVLGFLTKFCEKLPALRMNVSFLNMDPINLPQCIGRFNGKQKVYDRIDLASIAETGPQLAKALDSFGPLLKSRHQNPKATLITIFLDITLRMRTFADQKDWLSRKTATVQRFLSLDSTALSKGCYKADYLNFLSAHDLFLNRNAIFNRFVQSARLTQIGVPVNLEMKPRHTVIAKWPLRLPNSPTKHDFEMLHWSSHHGSERYIEWQRTL
ncbi:hypothetical protein BDW74DRAFT_164872 [Aspergillus multicolor]|uniref:DUF4470 domain-containing protein n=1 Tax=Aspergillus multicolor TaxID=41759 RepID=UPI003CCDC868